MTASVALIRLAFSGSVLPSSNRYMSRRSSTFTEVTRSSVRNPGGRMGGRARCMSSRVTRHHLEAHLFRHNPFSAYAAFWSNEVCEEPAPRLVSTPVAGSRDDPHDQSDQDEEEYAHGKPPKCAHAKSRSTHHGEPLLRLFEFPVWPKCRVYTLRSRPTGGTSLCRFLYQPIRSLARVFVRNG